jgi:hypothetical protein
VKSNLCFLTDFMSRVFKGTVSREFRLLVFFMNQFPPTPEYNIRPFQIFLKILGDIRSSRCATGVVNTGGKWKKSSVINILLTLFGHLWEGELTFSYILAFKFT